MTSPDAAGTAKSGQSAFGADAGSGEYEDTLLRRQRTNH
jgi:hypothetical protein